MADEAFAAWYTREHRRVLATLLVATGDAELAQDATSEAFARALERWPRVRDLASPTGWVFRTAFNVVNRRQRRRAIEARLLSRRPPPAATPALDVYPEVWAALRALPPRQRQAVALRYLADLPESNVAEAMGVAVGTISATLSAARRRLQGLLTQDGGLAARVEEQGG